MKSCQPSSTSHNRLASVLPVDRFVCLLADTEESKRIHYNLRYKVFCEETGFEDPTAFPDHAERDRYDTYAKHFIIWDRFKKRWAGGMRLVDASSVRLPSEEIVRVPLRGLAERRPYTVEFSRLCILSEYRRITQSTMPARRDSDCTRADWISPVVYKQEDNDILLRLLRASFSFQPEVQYCYFIVTAVLGRVLGQLGIPLTQVGDRVEHRGRRIPFRYDVRDAEAGMIAKSCSFAAMVESSPSFIRYSAFANDPGASETISAPYVDERVETLQSQAA